MPKKKIKIIIQETSTATHECTIEVDEIISEDTIYGIAEFICKEASCVSDVIDDIHKEFTVLIDGIDESNWDESEFELCYTEEVSDNDAK